MHGRRLVALVVLFLTVLIASCIQPEAEQAGSPEYQKAVWALETGGVSRIDADSGKVVLTLPHSDGAQAIALDAGTARVWVFINHRLRAYGFNGEMPLDVAVPGSASGLPQVALAADDASGAVWLGHGEALFRYGPDGALLATLALEESIAALAFDGEGETVWVLTNSGLRHFDRSGVLLGRIELAPDEPAAALAWDPFLKELWLATRSRLLRYDGTHTLRLTQPLAGLTYLAPDGYGALWAGNPHYLYRLDAGGRMELSLDSVSASGERAIRALTTDTADASAWIAGDQTLRRLDANGTVVRNFSLQGVQGFGYIHAIANYADTAVPAITIDTPVDGSYINEPRPAIGLSFADTDTGIGVDSGSLDLRADHEPLEVDCAFEGTTAECLPIGPFSEGSIRLDAVVADHAGNRAVAEPVTFTLDTTPPSITLDQPQDGQWTNTSELTVAGQVSEPAEVSVKGTAVGLDAQQRFSRVIGLEEGANPIAISARDRSGNTAALTHTVFLDTVIPALPEAGRITISDPVDGAVTVSGTAQAAETGATVRITNRRTGKTVSVTVAADGSFTLAIQAQAGDPLDITVIDRAGNSSAILAAAVPGGSALGLQITSPPVGSVVGRAVRVTGIYHGPTNAGVVVNGMPALLGADGRFIADQVEVGGDGLISAVAQTLHGESVKTEVYVVVRDLPPVVALMAESTRGIAPFTTTFRPKNVVEHEVDEVAMDFDADGLVDYRTQNPSEAVTHTFNSSGLYGVTMTVRMKNGDVHQAAVAVLVQSSADLDVLLRGVWGGMNQALTNGDVQLALNYVARKSRKRYEPVFDALREHMGEIVSSYSEPITVTLTEGMGEYAVNRVIDGEDYIFLIYFMKDAAGVWRVAEM
jgi:hypothetical protein